MGCNDQTFSGLAGIGDLIVTATSDHSRNNRCGKLIGQGFTPEEAVKQVGMVVEGINALPAAVELARKFGVEMPITQTAYDVVFNGASPKDAVMTLMTRDKKSETENIIVI
jgi:glycerol-3-phosphate dehydrogenase (NAD(P)+)